MTDQQDDTLFSAYNIYVKKSNVHGRGVFAGKLFNQEEIIEIFPLTPMSFRTRYQGDLGILTYAFINDKCPCEECKKHGSVVYLAMGYGSTYNHQDSPNAELVLDFANLKGTVLASKNIEKDSEIFIKYDDNYPFLDGKVTVHE